MRKRFLCFRPGNGCISTAAAAVYHYANVTRALIFGYCLYMLKADCGTSSFRSGLLGLLFAEKEDLKMNEVLPTVFENFFFFFLQKGNVSPFGKHRPDVTSLHKQPEQIRPVT